MADTQEKINVAEEKLDNIQASGNPFRKREFVYRKKLPEAFYSGGRGYRDIKKDGGWYSTSPAQVKAMSERGILIPGPYADTLGFTNFIAEGGSVDWDKLNAFVKDNGGKNDPDMKIILEDAREYQNNFDIYQENKKYDEWESRNNPVQKTRMEDLESAIAEKKQTPSVNVKGIDTAAYLDRIINKQR